MRAAATGLRRANFRAPVDASHLRLTVDYPDDLQLVRRLLESLRSDGLFDFYDLLRAIGRDPSLPALNPHMRNEALRASA